MNENKAKKILSMIGPVIVIGALITLAVGVRNTRIEHSALMLSGSKRDLTAIVSGGIGMMISALANLAEGVTSLLASRNARFAGPAWLCSLFSVISNLVSGVSSIVHSGFSVMTLAGLITALGLAINVYVAAGKLKKTHQNI